MEVLKLDNTYRGILHSCKRKHFLTKELGLIPTRGSNPLRFGSTWHAFMEGYYSHIKENGWSRDGGAIKQASEYGAAVWKYETDAYGQNFDDTDYRTLNNCTVSFLEYVAEFQYDFNMLKVIETEQMFDHVMELSKKDLKDFPNLANLEVHFQGRLDVQVALSDLPWIMEVKSTGQSIGIQCERLNRSPQILGYSYAGRHALNFPAEGCLVSIHQISSRRKKDGEWGKVTRVFQRPPHIFTDEDLAAWRLSFLSTCSELVEYQKKDIWPMQFDSCYQFGRCQFCNICERNEPLNRIRDDVAEGIIPEGYLSVKKNFLDFSTKRLIEKIKRDKTPFAGKPSNGRLQIYDEGPGINDNQERSNFDPFAE